MAQEEPANPRLWALYVAQAKAHFRTYPSPAASHWVHEHYEKSGGRFIRPEDEKPKDKKERLKHKKEVHKHDHDDD